MSVRPIARKPPLGGRDGINLREGLGSGRRVETLAREISQCGRVRRQSALVSGREQSGRRLRHQHRGRAAESTVVCGAGQQPTEHPCCIGQAFADSQQSIFSPIGQSGPDPAGSAAKDRQTAAANQNVRAVRNARTAKVYTRAVMSATAFSFHYRPRCKLRG